MKIMLMGCDGTGKTTLATRLAITTGAKLVHFGPPEEKEDGKLFSDISEKNRYMEHIVSPEDTIMDRGFYCEPVYGKVLRGESLLTKEDIRELEYAMLDQEHVVFYCEDDSDAIKERLEKRGDALVSIGMVDSIMEEYEKVIEDSSLSIVRIRPIQKRIRPSMDKTMMSMALILADRSTCDGAHVGALVTSGDGMRVLGMGYNGNAAGRKNECDNESFAGVGCGCVHAEVNALVKSRWEPGRIIYTTLAPCQDCAKAIINAGIKKVFWLDSWKHNKGLKILEQGKVYTQQLKW